MAERRSKGEHAVSAAGGVASRVQIRIFSDQGVLADALVRVLREEGYAPWIGEIGASMNLRVNAPTLEIVDADSAGAGDVVRLLRAATNRIVLLNVGDSRRALEDWAWVEADACVTRSSSLVEFLELLRRVIAGERVFSANAAPLLLEGDRRLLALPLRPRLTQRETQIVELVRRGYPNKMIAAELTLEISTVKNHLHRIFAKSGVKSRAELRIEIVNE